MATTNTTTKRKSQQRQAAIRIVILLAILVCANILAFRLHYGLDLTREKRFTLSPSTKQMLSKLDDVVVIEVYLKGSDFPPYVERLVDETRDKLSALNDYSNTKIIYSFINPFEGKTEEEKGPIFQDLAKKGIVGKPLSQMNSEGSYSEQIYFPYAMVSYKGRQMSVSLVESSMGYSNEETLNYSGSMLEYKFANAIHKLEMPDKPTIAYMVGHGEPLNVYTADMLTTLAHSYHVDTFDLTQYPYINPVVYSAIIINKPTTTIHEQEKFKIDQYIMRGGRVLWCIDPVQATNDSLQSSGIFVTQNYTLNLEDMLFNYGARVNTNLIEDMQCNVIPVTVGVTEQGGAQLDNRPWMYFPVFVPTSRHPIVNNMNAIMGMYASSIDTVGNPAAKKTILLESSKYSRIAASPVRVNMNMLQFQLREDMFQKPYQPVAVLLEGNFTSIFRNKILAPNMLRYLRDDLKQPYKDKTDTATSMIIVGDGDMFINGFTQSNGFEPMGFWKYNKSYFANKSFLLNCMEYLTDQDALLEARTKDVKLRLLDKGRVQQEQTQWKVVNLGIPIALILVFASAYSFFRKRRYETKRKEG